jgi:leucyl/phenylalanyl-tRNA--protein transferase
MKLIDAEFLIGAYCNGYFPMADSNTGEIHWYSPDPRTIFDLDKFHIPRSLKIMLKKQPFTIRIDQRFEEVMRACAERHETWISETIIQSYLQLSRMGFAHSIETWSNGELVGGLYGVSIRGAFFGESMFSKVRDASKVALVHLVELLKKRKYLLLDTQYMTPHLERFGAQEIPREEYLRRLQVSLTEPCTFADGEL